VICKLIIIKVGIKEPVGQWFTSSDVSSTLKMEQGPPAIGAENRLCLGTQPY
jgi:hypothetical protein